MNRCVRSRVAAIAVLLLVATAAVGGRARSQTVGLESTCANDTWNPINVAGVPDTSILRNGSAVWTGNEMLIWSGFTQSQAGAGARYNPVTNSWRAMSMANQPSPRGNFNTLWTGAEFIVWGGGDFHGNLLNTGALYDPATDAWTSMSTVNAPTPSAPFSAVWDGTEMIVWGGAGGGRYNPATDTWTSMSELNAPPQDAYNAPNAVWTGSEVLYWGNEYKAGYIGFVPSGGRYNPASDTWQPMNLTGAPYYSVTAVPKWGAVWTGTEMLVWNSQSGGQYDPATDSWIPITNTNAPPVYSYANATIWTGTEMIVWGNQSTNAGGRYNPTTSVWTPMSLSGAPPDGIFTTVWTGSQMLVVGFTSTDDSPIGAAYCAAPPPPCTYTLSPVGISLESVASGGSLSVTCANGCPWSASSDVDWIGFTSAPNGIGTGSATYAVAPNTETTPRTGHIKVGDQSITVTQSGVPNITSVVASGKNLIVTGTAFDIGAVVLVNGVAQKTKFGGTGVLIGKKSARKIPIGTTVSVQVKNRDGVVSQAVSFLNQ